VEDSRYSNGGVASVHRARAIYRYFERTGSRSFGDPTERVPRTKCAGAPDASLTQLDAGAPRFVSALLTPAAAADHLSLNGCVNNCGRVLVITTPTK
jgi:hypothetical protein